MGAARIASGRRAFFVDFMDDSFRNCSLGLDGFNVCATSLSRALDQTETFYAVTAGPDGAIGWTETTEGGETLTFDNEPNTSAFQRGMVTFMSWLPVEWIL